MTINDLSIPFDHLNRETLLSDWKWLTGETNLPVLITKAGDAFLQNKDTKEVSFLDVVNGSCNIIAPNGEEFSQKLTDVDFVVEFFAVNIVASLIKSEQIEDGKLYSWKKAPVLGGSYTTDNLEQTDIEVHFSIMGQIHEQVKGMPEGSTISEIKIKE